MIGIFKKPVPPKRQPDSHLLIRTPDRASELIMATPILEEAVWDTRWPQVTILHPPELGVFLEDGPLESHSTPWPTRRTRAHLESLSADALLQLGGPVSVARLVRSLGIGTRAGLGGGIQRHWFTHWVQPATVEGRPMAASYQHVLRDVAGLVGIWPRNLQPRLYASAQGEDELRNEMVEAGLEPGAGYVLCAPTAERGPAADWSPASFAQVLDQLFVDRDLTAVIAVDGDDEALGQAVRDACSHPAQLFVESEAWFARRKLLCRRAKLVISSGAAMAWCGAAFGVPSVALFGPDPAELSQTSFAPLATVAVEGLECAPCGSWTCPLKHHRCMTELTPAAVLARVERLLEREVPA